MIHTRRKLVNWLLALGILHSAILCGGFLAPYDPVQQDREHPYAGPMALHFVDLGGHFHPRPFFYGLLHHRNGSGFEEDTAHPVALTFLMRGEKYKFAGLIGCSLHLFGADGERVYLLGTDGYGRDQLSRIICGGQISLLAGLLGAGITLLFGLLAGATAGYYGGWRDTFLMRLAELFLALPWLYLLLALRAFLPLDVSPVMAFLLIVSVIAVVGWARPARLVRGIVLSAKERDFVQAARGFGASDAYLFRRHLLPETSSVLLTQAAILIPQYVLVEMTLSFLGLGVPQPIPSWGSLLANLQHYSVLVSCWWMYLPAVAAIPFFVCYLGLASSLQGTDTRSMCV